MSKEKGIIHPEMKQTHEQSTGIHGPHKTMLHYHHMNRFRCQQATAHPHLVQANAGTLPSRQ